jgi:hypothetical protein
MAPAVAGLVSRDQAGDTNEMRRHSGVGEPIGALAVGTVDGERLKPPSSAFPSGSPATSMAGFSYAPMPRALTRRARLHANLARRCTQRRGPRDAHFSRCSAASWRGCLLALIVPAPVIPLPTAAMQRRSSQRRQLCRGSITKPHRGVKTPPPTILKMATSMIPRPATSPSAIVPIKITKIPKAVRLIPCDVITPPAPFLTLRSIRPPSDAERGANYSWRCCCRRWEGSKEAGKLQSQQNGNASRYESQRGKSTNECESATCDF